VQRRELLLKSAATVAAGTGLGVARIAAGSEGAPAAKPPRSPFVAAKDGTALHYQDWGAGRPVLFVASASLPSQMWQYQMAPMIEEELRCVAYDRRGHGRSGSPAHGYDYDTLADDLAAVIDLLDLREVTLVGYSMGAGEVVRYLSRHGSGRVARIALVAPVTPCVLKGEDNPDGVPAEYFEKVRTDTERDYPKWCADNADAFFVPETSAGMRRWVIDLALGTSLPAVLACNHSFSTADFRAELPKVAVPALVIQGNKDASAPIDLTGRKTAALIPGCRLEVYEGAPHGLFVTHMERLTSDLLGFIRGDR
jgi:non-heme chloroperoxidase